MEWEHALHKAEEMLKTDDKNKGKAWWGSPEKRKFSLDLSEILKYPCLGVAMMGAGVVWFYDRKNPYIKLRRTHPLLGDIWIEKIRTMQVGSENEEDLVFGEGSLMAVKNGRDKRVTKVGRMLRKYSIDELPQVKNVIRKEIALVGPRMWTETEERNLISPNSTKYPFKEMWEYYEQGLMWGWVGLASVLARNEESMDRRWELELMYAEQASKTGDFRILKTMLTNGVLLQGR